MTTSERERYHRQYMVWLIVQERTVRKLTQSKLSSLADLVTARYPATGADGLESVVTDALFYDLLSSIYIRVGVSAAERTYGSLMQKKDRDPLSLPDILPPANPGNLQAGFQSARWRVLMQRMVSGSETARRVTQMAGKTRQLIRDVLSRGAEQNLSIQQVARKLRSVIADPVRALLIARTETTRAASAGAEIGAESSRLRLNKVWIATADLRTRDAHRSMLGSAPIPANGLFMVGGRAMKYPGDPAGGAAMVCRCRCGIAYVPVTINLNN